MADWEFSIVLNQSWRIRDCTKLKAVDYKEFNDKYNKRDAEARNNMRKLVDSDANKVINVFSTLF